MLARNFYIITEERHYFNQQPTFFICCEFLGQEKHVFEQKKQKLELHLIDETLQILYNFTWMSLPIHICRNHKCRT